MLDWHAQVQGISACAFKRVILLRSFCQRISITRQNLPLPALPLFHEPVGQINRSRQTAVKDVGQRTSDSA